MIKLVVFDFDDTLIDNRELDYQAFRLPSIKLKLKIPSKQKIKNFRKKGLLAKQIALQLYGKRENNKLIKDFLFFRKKFIHSIDTIPYLKIKNNTKKVLRFLKRKNIICCISSVRRNKNTIKKFLVKEKINSYFQQIYLANDVKPEIKRNNPSSRILTKIKIILKIKKRYGVNSEDIIYVGNNEEDLEAALKTGVSFVFFKNSYLSDLNNNNLVKVHTMSDLQKKLERLIRV